MTEEKLTNKGAQCQAALDEIIAACAADTSFDQSKLPALEAVKGGLVQAVNTGALSVGDLVHASLFMTAHLLGASSEPMEREAVVSSYADMFTAYLSIATNTPPKQVKLVPLTDHSGIMYGSGSTVH